MTARRFRYAQSAYRPGAYEVEAYVGGVRVTLGTVRRHREQPARGAVWWTARRPDGTALTVRALRGPTRFPTREAAAEALASEPASLL